MFSYDYILPESLIAKKPATPRDAARLFVYDTRTNEIALDTFAHLDDYLPKDSLLVLNDTKVIPARAMLTKHTGGKIEVLFLVNEWQQPGPVPVLVDRKITVGARLFFDAKTFLTVVQQNENIFYLEPSFAPARLFSLLNKKGITPLPKYIKGSGLSEKELRKQYQTVFGKNSASVAAPTASLHFTQRLLNKLEKGGVRKAFVTLDVGLGTFAPVSQESLANGTLHTEFLMVPADSARAIADHHRAGKPVVAVGTTAVRVLESQASRILSRKSNDKVSEIIVDKTQIFIKPPHAFKATDALITNFHLPTTSLMMLVQAFLEYKHAKKNVVELYEVAIKEQFRFYSFGDGMLIK